MVMSYMLKGSHQPLRETKSQLRAGSDSFVAARVIRRKAKRLIALLELATPKREGALERLALQRLALPLSEIRVTERQRFELGHASLQEGAIAFGQFEAQDAH